jgi:hypothetical protein
VSVVQALENVKGPARRPSFRRFRTRGSWCFAAPSLQKQIEAVKQLPNTKQPFVSQMLDTVLAH